MTKTIRDRAEIPCLAITDYILRLPKNPKRLILLLHGFTENGEIIFNRLESLFNEDDAILAPNGCYPLPEKKEDHYKIGFAWYFYDNLKNEYFIDFKIATHLLKNLITSLNLDQLDKTIIGYSQGGYLAPFAANNLTKVKSIIGLACVYRYDLLETIPEVPIHLIHGDCDPLVDPNRSKEYHQKLLEKGAKGKFIMLKDEGHRLTSKFKDELIKLI